MNTNEKPPPLSKEEYCARFKAQMLRHAEKFDDGSSVAEYADEVAPICFEENDGFHTPEDDADADVSYWGE